MAQIKMPEDLGLGRRHAPDPKDLLHPMLAALPPEAVDLSALPNSKYWYANAWWGDQGGTSQCVAFAWTHWLEDGPVTHKQPAPLIQPSYLYGEAQKNDEWPGEDYDGTSVRAGAKVLQAMGYVGEYTWAFDVETVVAALLSRGPVVVGTNWYQNMFYPDPKTGIVKPDGALAGGHAWKLDGANQRTQLIRFKNSWGRDWGKRGHAYISFEALDRLIKEDGEACLALELAV
jgi:hypothetical protein